MKSKISKIDIELEEVRKELKEARSKVGDIVRRKNSLETIQGKLKEVITTECLREIQAEIHYIKPPKIGSQFEEAIAGSCTFKTSQQFERFLSLHREYYEFNKGERYPITDAKYSGKGVYELIYRKGGSDSYFEPDPKFGILRRTK